MIDLHIHTTYSNGKNTPKEILKLAEKMKLEVISITDHDNVDAYYELEYMDISKYYSGKIIIGTELNCVYKGIKIELLAYNYDLEKMKCWLDEENGEIIKEKNYIKEVKYLYKKCLENNIVIQDKNFLENYNPKICLPSKYFYNEILKSEENRSKFLSEDIQNLGKFYRCICCKRDFPLYMDYSISLQNAKYVSNKIKEFGGKAFLAHLYGYPYVDTNKLLDELAKDNIIDGAETYYFSFNEEKSNYIKSFCIKNNLLMSAGSDFHGYEDIGGKLGNYSTDPNISIDLIKNWK